MKRQALLYFVGLLLWTGLGQAQTTADLTSNPIEALKSCEWKRTTASPNDLCRSQRMEVIRLFTSLILTALESPGYVWGPPSTTGLAVPIDTAIPTILPLSSRAIGGQDIKKFNMRPGVPSCTPGEDCKSLARCLRWKLGLTIIGEEE